MADTRAAHTETAEPRALADPRHVHGTVPDGIFSGAETLHHMQHSVLGGRVPDMLQRVRQLYFFQQQLRLGTVRQRLTGDHSPSATHSPPPSRRPQTLPEPRKHRL